MTFFFNSNFLSYNFPRTHPCDQGVHEDDYDEMYPDQLDEDNFEQLDQALLMQEIESSSEESSNQEDVSSYTMDNASMRTLESASSLSFEMCVDFQNSSQVIEPPMIQHLDNKIMQSILNDDASILSTFQTENIHLGTKLQNGQLLAFTLSSNKAFRILNAMSEKSLLDLDFPLDGKPFWLDFITRTSLATNVKAEGLGKNSLNILKNFLNRIAEHLESVPLLSTSFDQHRLIFFCLEQKKYHLIPKIILETSVFEIHLNQNQNQINEALFHALMDKRGIAATLSPKIEGGDPHIAAYMIMKAIESMLVKYSDFLEDHDLKLMCQRLLHSFGFHSALYFVRQPPKAAAYVLSALKSKISFPLLFEIGTKEHSMAMGISRINRSLQATIYNTGDGLNKHHSYIGKRPLTFLSTRPILTEKKLPWTRIFREVEDVNEVYSKIEALFLSKEEVEVDDSIYCEASQKRGSCSFQSLMAFLQHEFLEHFQGSLETRKGAYKLFKTLLMTSLVDIYKERAYPSYHSLFESKYNIHHAELALFLDIDEAYYLNLFDFLFSHEELIKELYFAKIVKRYIECENHSIHSNFYFLLKILRFITYKNMTINVPTELQKDSIAHLIETLQATPRLHKKDTTF